MIDTTQNNSFTKFLPYVVITGLVIALFWQRGCNGTPSTVTVTTPEVKGKSDTIYLPVPMPQKEKEYVYRYLPAGSKDTILIKSPNPVNQDLLNFYLDNQNKRDSLYTDAIGEREYNIPLEDSLLLTENYIKVQGKVLAFQQNYTIKPRKVSVPIKQDNFKLLAGVEAGNTLKLDGFVVKGNVGLQLGKGQLNLGYDTDNRAWIGYSWVLIK